MFLSTEYIYIVISIIIYLAFFPNKKWPFFVIMAYMIFLGVFRELDVGTDHRGYENDFYILNSYESIKLIHHRFEIGYISLILLFKKFSNDYLWFSGLTFLVPMIGTMFFIKKYKINYAWGLFVFFFMGMYFDSMNLMRQYMAICSIAAFTYLLKEQRYKQFALVVIIFSVAFHQSSLIMLLLIPIFYYFGQRQHYLSKKQLYICIITSYLLFYIGPKVIAPVLTAIINVLPIDNSLGGYVSNYDEQELSNTMVTVYTIYALLLIYFNKSREGNAELMCFVFFIMAYNIFNMFSTYAFRTSLPFKYYMISLIPILISNNKKKSSAIMLEVVTIIFMSAVFFVSFVIGNNNEINPYETWF